MTVEQCETCDGFGFAFAKFAILLDWLKQVWKYSWPFRNKSKTRVGSFHAKCQTFFYALQNRGKSGKS